MVRFSLKCECLVLQQELQVRAREGKHGIEQIYEAGYRITLENGASRRKEIMRRIIRST
jgi:hypothetical protein